MTWLFGQLWFWLLIAFAAGSVVTWAIAAMTLPHEDELEDKTGIETKGLLS